MSISGYVTLNDRRFAPRTCARPPLATNDPVLEEQFDERFLCHQFVLEIGLLLSAEKGDIKFSRWRARPHFIGLAAELRLGRRTALTFPLFPPPQKN
jgi:hypothetical protein